MKNTKTVTHTPGPWHVNHNISVHIDSEDGRFVAAVSADEDGNKPEDGYIPYAEGEANAALIAAAPDLLAACMAASAYLTPPASRFPENRKAAAEMIEAAIHKAQGGI